MTTSLTGNVFSIEKTRLMFSTKAKTLLSLSSYLKNALILPIQIITAKEWSDNKESAFKRIKQEPWVNQALVIRSSALNEDTESCSMAGEYLSILDVSGEDDIHTSIDSVFSSYDTYQNDNEVLIQPLLTDIKLSGVAFSQDPNTNAPYYVINYDDNTRSTQTVTSGTSSQTKCYVWHKASDSTPQGYIGQIIKLLIELEQLFDSNLIDIEFAINTKNEIYLFQARPLIIKDTSSISFVDHTKAITRIYNKINVTNGSHPYLHGNKGIYGVMPDWNPAEIIGIRPKPLALSLYRDLITNSVWAYQRDNYGYKNLRSFPLLIDFEGLPYVDVRVSFNSFIPKSIDEILSEKLVNYYIEQLSNNQTLHDKIEFDIVFSCYTLDLKEKLQHMVHHSFTKKEIETLFNALVSLTFSIIKQKDNFWLQDLHKIDKLKKRQEIILNSTLEPISKIYWLMEDCKRYGTLPFAGLARAAFISVQILKSLLSIGIINETEYSAYFSSLDSVSTSITQDLHKISRNDFLTKYGHLRPGTYDINSFRYDEKPDEYFNFNEKNTESELPPPIIKQDFALKIPQLTAIQKKLNDDGLDINILELFDFIKSTIEGREYAKFIFSKSISDSMKILCEYAQTYGFSRDDCSYIDASIIASLYCTSSNPKDIIDASIRLGKSKYTLTQSITLPPVLTNPKDAWSFYYPESLPNFITQKKTEGKITFPSDDLNTLQGTILFIPSADPGYDWIFTHKIAGFVTMFGGINSHMAIRASELEIPAIIGAGESNYKKWSQYSRIGIDASNRLVYPL